MQEREISSSASVLNEIKDLYNNAPCGLHSLDKDGVFVRVNDTELRWLGYTRDELIGKMKITDLLAPGSVETIEEHFARPEVPGIRARYRVAVWFARMAQSLSVLVSAAAAGDSQGQLSRSEPLRGLFRHPRSVCHRE